MFNIGGQCPLLNSFFWYYGGNRAYIVLQPNYWGKCPHRDRRLGGRGSKVAPTVSPERIGISSCGFHQSVENHKQILSDVLSIKIF